MERLVIYDANHLDCSGLYSLAQENKDIVVGERLHPLTSQTADETATIAAVFVTSKVDNKALIRMPQLKLLVTLSTGTDHIDLKECAARGITVCNVPTYGEETVAEYAFAMMLSLSRRLPEATERLKGAVAEHADLVGFDLAGKTLTIIGAGRIGRNVARIAGAFKMTVLAVDPYPGHAAGFEYVGLHDGLRRADIVSLHSPLTPETKHVINRNSLGIMKPGAILINTARGELIDTTALLHALHVGQLGGAGLDVVEREDLLGGNVEMNVLSDGIVQKEILRDIAEHEALLKLPNVIFTNHNAFNTHEAQGRIIQGGLDAIRGFLSGKPVNVVGK